MSAFAWAGSMNRPHILKVDGDDPDGELAFELEWLQSLTTQERFELMLRKSRELKEMLERHGHRKPFEVIKRS